MDHSDVPARSSMSAVCALGYPPVALRRHTVHRRVGTNQLDVEDLHTCFEHHLSAAATRHIQPVDRVRDDRQSETQIIFRNGVAGQISSGANISPVVPLGRLLATDATLSDIALNF